MENYSVEKNNEKIEKPLPLPTQLEMSTSLNEPKTLSHDELNLAREEALKVINTHTREEALKIFLTGLKPVTKLKAD